MTQPEPAGACIAYVIPCQSRISLSPTVSVCGLCGVVKGVEPACV
jgi:hypothetical protein